MSMRIILLQLDPTNSNSVISNFRYFELKTICLGFALQLFPIGYLELPLFRTIFRLPCKLEIAGFNCLCYVKSDVSGYCRILSEREASNF